MKNNELKKLSRMQQQIIFKALYKFDHPSTNDKRVRKHVLEHSSSHEYDEARSEWGFTGNIVFEEDHAFRSHCELCGAHGLKVNFMIFNEKTDKVLCVGSTCVKKFLLLNGSKSMEDSISRFQSQVKEAILLPCLRSAYDDSIKKRPYKRDIAQFHKNLKELLNYYGRSFPSFTDNIDFIVDWLYPGRTFIALDRMEQFKLRQLLNNPRDIDSLSESTKSHKDSTIDFSWYKKRRSNSTTTTLSTSSAYRPDAKYSPKKNDTDK